MGIIGIIGLLSFLVTLGIAYWVYQDAQTSNANNPELWAVATALAGVFANLFGLVVVVTLYLLVGRR